MLHVCEVLSHLHREVRLALSLVGPLVEQPLWPVVVRIDKRMVEAGTVVCGFIVIFAAVVQMRKHFELLDVVLVDFDVLRDAVVPSAQLLDILRVLLVLIQVTVIIRLVDCLLLLQDVRQLSTLQRYHLEVVFDHFGVSLG